MSITAKTLFNSGAVSDTATTIYTVPEDRTTIIDKFTATNTDGSARTLTVYIVPDGAVSAVSNTILSAFSITAGLAVDLDELKNQILSEGDSIVVQASVTDVVVVRVSGREIT